MSLLLSDCNKLSHFHTADIIELCQQQDMSFSGAGSLTVLRRTNSKSKLPSCSSSRTSSIAESDSYASADLGTDKLPAIDTPEATHVCSVR